MQHALSSCTGRLITLLTDAGSERGLGGIDLGCVVVQGVMLTRGGVVDWAPLSAHAWCCTHGQIGQ